VSFATSYIPLHLTLMADESAARWAFRSPERAMHLLRTFVVKVDPGFGSSLVLVFAAVPPEELASWCIGHPGPEGAELQALVPTASAQRERSTADSGEHFARLARRGRICVSWAEAKQ